MRLLGESYANGRKHARTEGCSLCGRRPPEIKFHPSTRSAKCTGCWGLALIARYQHKADAIDALKLERGCADCGYRGHPSALDFDHLPGYEKSFTIAQKKTNFPLEALLQEAKKCEVVCANCHRVRTVARKQAELDELRAHQKAWQQKLAAQNQTFDLTEQGEAG